MKIEEITTVCFVGAGVMGCYNALISAMAGYSVTLQDRDVAALQTVDQRMQGIIKVMVDNKLISTDIATAAVASMRRESDLALALKDADLVSESVFERLDVKQEVLAAIEANAKPEAIITSNTSSLVGSAISARMLRPEQFAAFHSYLGSPLLDVVPVAKTHPVVTQTLFRYGLSLGGKPMILDKEFPGYVLNALIGTLLSTSMELLLTGTADHEEIDRAWVGRASAVMGPFGMLDLFGLDVVQDSWKKSIGQPGSLTKHEAIDLVDGMLSKGRSGMKVGAGFYDYPQPAYSANNFLQSKPVRPELADLLMARLQQTSEALLAAGITTRDKLNETWRVGMKLELDIV